VLEAYAAAQLTVATGRPAVDPGLQVQESSSLVDHHQAGGVSKYQIILSFCLPYGILAQNFVLCLVDCKKHFFNFLFTLTVSRISI
jgi:hypothetical protein